MFQHIPKAVEDRPQQLLLVLLQIKQSALVFTSSVNWSLKMAHTPGPFHVFFWFLMNPWISGVNGVSLGYQTMISPTNDGWCWHDVVTLTFRFNDIHLGIAMIWLHPISESSKISGIHHYHRWPIHAGIS